MIQKKTKIICTIGPKSEAKETLTQMVELGMNVCRLNFSHGDYSEHGARIQTIKEVREATGTNLAILLDTKGPEIRTHNMENDAIMLETGKDVIVSMTEVLGTTEKFSITYGELVHDVKAGDTILLDDGLIGLTVNKVDVEGGLIYTTIQNGGVLKNKKELTYQVYLQNYQVSLQKMKRIFVSDVNKILTSLLLHSFVQKKTY